MHRSDGLLDVALEDAPADDSGRGRIRSLWRRSTKLLPEDRSMRTFLVGPRLATDAAAHQTIGVLIGLAVFASDSLSSVAYATQEILLILVAAGTAAFAYALPISIAIVALLVILAISYEQTIHAYPNGGGAYIVAMDNLGVRAAQIAGAALLTDYILTVAVSVSSGVAQITSAFPFLYHYRVSLAVGCVLLIMTVNLRGVRESGAVFAIPTYFFVLTMAVTLIVAFVRYLGGTLGMVVNPPPMEAPPLAPIGAFLILHAFASGTTALTGVEAVSNGIPAFREPKSRNAGVTLIWMAAILGVCFLSITFLSVHIGAVPSDRETVISQLARTVFGSQGFLYLCSIAGTTLILIMAANTSFADFPRLSALHAVDGFLPKQLTYRGSRLVYSHGIEVLSALACILIVLFRANTSALIPLYCIGVFLSFTLSQAGMTRRWWKIGRLAPGQLVQERSSVLKYERSWRVKLAINAVGAVCTGVVVLVFAYTKFLEGAWIVIVLIPALVALFFSIHRHYRELAANLSLDALGTAPRVPRHRVILPVSSVHRGTITALHYARTLSTDITAVHVATDAANAAEVEEKWASWGEGVRLVTIESPYRTLLEPLLEYIEEILSHLQPDEAITIVVPQFVPRRRWHNLLHAQTAVFLRMALLFKPGVVVTNVPYHMRPRAALAEAHGDGPSPARVP